MRSIERLAEYENTEFDRIIIKIRKGDIKCGKYSHLVKIDRNIKTNGKEFFKNGSKSK